MSPVDRRRRRSSGSKPQVANRDGRLHALAWQRAAVWMGVGSIIKKDWMKMAKKICRRCRFQDVVARSPSGPSRPSLRPHVPVWMGRVGVEKGRVTWYVYCMEREVY